ncbi:uncharacterized protein EDB91DRAFT_1236327 [Suillus paluster]|uniref:uncharacterized protein n=1 Tax=Suillus paluster TaxID=48578 RepID=UPI001B87ECD0|nr:uncharacterized protein EDB91DRAFT_1236327 [Suillus paluster]KAG1745394.1 hypothetical protein EDB91DRAFT_1236327 [Suillus paluster]
MITVQAASLPLHSPRFMISASDVTQLLFTKKPEPLTLGATDTLKFTFQITENDNGKVSNRSKRSSDSMTVSGKEGIQPVRVTPGGKAKFELVLPTCDLHPSPQLRTDSLEVSFMLGSFVHAPEKYDLFDLSIPTSQTPTEHSDEASFHILPVIKHTFRPDQRSPPRLISAVFAAAWSKINFRVYNLFAPSIVPFTALLAVLNRGIFAIPTVFAGKQALFATGEWRAGRK